MSEIQFQQKLNFILLHLSNYLHQELTHENRTHIKNEISSETYKRRLKLTTVHPSEHSTNRIIPCRLFYEQIVSMNILFFWEHQHKYPHQLHWFSRNLTFQKKNNQIIFYLSTFYIYELVINNYWKNHDVDFVDPVDKINSSKTIQHLSKFLNFNSFDDFISWLFIGSFDSINLNVMLRNLFKKSLNNISEFFNLFPEAHTQPPFVPVFRLVPMRDTISSCSTNKASPPLRSCTRDWCPHSWPQAVNADAGGQEGESRTFSNEGGQIVLQDLRFGEENQSRIRYARLISKY
jgi:hypothetical protein